MNYLQVFINAIVVALMAMYVYKNEEIMEKMSTKHYQTEKELDELKMVAKSTELKLSTKAETEKLIEIENQQIAGTRKLYTEIENQQIAATRKLTEVENQLNAETKKSNEKALALERKLADEIKDMKQLLSTKAEKKGLKLQIRYTFVWGKHFNDFKPIFKACSGNKQSILDTWKKSKMEGDISNIKESCTNRHLRSTLIDNWNGSLIDQVKVELFKNEQLAVEMYFDGRGSTSSNWFTRSRLRDNSFNDLTRMSTFNFFSMNG
ncbi:Hypothetical predicted protein [Mytilus galloprovincialis]|uniref:Uncharacterized protein n=1 Tax=Mytilus galloprovincialis TaxID=29158 RepID=A0A8B6F5P1_MYTGA|nr:Hypothetical predicted protein [Mytilus galloprovincialis]